MENYFTECTPGNWFPLFVSIRQKFCMMTLKYMPRHANPCHGKKQRRTAQMNENEKLREDEWSEQDNGKASIIDWKRKVE